MKRKGRKERRKGLSDASVSSLLTFETFLEGFWRIPVAGTWLGIGRWPHWGATRVFF